MRRGGVHQLSQRTEANAARLEIGHRREEMRQRSSEPIQLPYDQAVAGPDEFERFGEASTFAAAAADPILEQVTFINPRGKERIPLQIKSLAIAVGGNAHIADKHVRKTSANGFPHNGSFRHGLSTTLGAKSALILAPESARRKTVVSRQAL